MNQQYPPQMMNQAPEPVAEKQGCGFTIAILGLIGSIFMTLGCASFALFVPAPLYLRAAYGAIAFAGIFSGVFYGTILSQEDYLKGKPAITKMWPLWLSSLSILVFYVFVAMFIRNFAIIPGAVIMVIAQLGVYYAMYFMDDDSGSCCLCFKPYIFRKPVMMMDLNYGYPPQGYPPQQGYAPQAYPPQQGYPQQGYPPQVHPQQQYPKV